jgi:N-acetylglucosamine-6-phosphate deacetylase
VLSQVVTERFFDGHALHGPTLLHLSEDGVVEAVEASTRTPDVYLVAPGLVDVQMNGFDDVDVFDLAGKTLLLDKFTKLLLNNQDLGLNIPMRCDSIKSILRIAF